MMKTAVIICTRNRVFDLIRALRSIRNQTILPSELIIVDSSDDLLTFAPEFKAIFKKDVFPGVRLEYIHMNPGLTSQRNRGIEAALSEILYFFDDDVELESNYLEEMNRIFFKNSYYAGGMGCVTNICSPPSQLHRLFRKIFLLQRDFSDGCFTWSGMPTHAYGRKEFLEVEVLGGCCFAFRRGIVKKYLFDETLANYSYMEDCDISKRISDSYKLFYNPHARLKHFHSPVARDKIVDNRAMYIRNYSYLFFKNFYPQNKLSLLGYLWSIKGLFVEAFLFLRFKELLGYCRGLLGFWMGK